MSEHAQDCICHMCLEVDWMRYSKPKRDIPLAITVGLPPPKIDDLSTLRAQLAEKDGELKRLAERFKTTPEHAVTVALTFVTSADGVMNTLRAGIAERDERIAELERADARDVSRITASERQMFHGQIAQLQKRIAALERLRAYARHKDSCHANSDPSKCTCGLDEVQKD
jgi:hypothetical protein